MDVGSLRTNVETKLADWGMDVLLWQEVEDVDGNVEKVSAVFGRERAGPQKKIFSKAAVFIVKKILTVRGWKMGNSLIVHVRTLKFHFLHEEEGRKGGSVFTDFLFSLETFLHPRFLFFCLGCQR